MIGSLYYFQFSKILSFYPDFLFKQVSVPNVPHFANVPLNLVLSPRGENVFVSLDAKNNVVRNR